MLTLCPSVAHVGHHWIARRCPTLAHVGHHWTHLDRVVQSLEREREKK